ncbi:formate dehydrogenase subunit delta [Sphingobium sp.]|uniref:formate dehydrogenase subunit delta n=1 Tax=Sphingobium sp. TaxID=1912891 RepID=UPI0028BE2DE9|nr:formate dehydrogenase subunit delta [Sphingobium sp.]
MSPQDRLVYMANQIARNLAMQGEGVAVAEVAAHIMLFWDPAMKARLLELDMASLDPIVVKAVENLRCHPAVVATIARERSKSGGSDAG